MTAVWLLLALLAEPDDLTRLAALGGLPEASAVWLRREKLVTTDGGGRQTVTWTGTLRLLTEDGVRYATVPLAITAPYQEPRLEVARMLAPGGRPIDVGTAALRSRRVGPPGLAGESLLAWELRFPFAEPGAVLDWRWTVSDRFPTMPEGFADWFAAQTELPVMQATYAVRVPAGSRLGEAADALLGEPLVTRRGQADEYRWQARDLEPLRQGPSEEQVRGPGLGVWVSQSSWRAAAERYALLSSARCVPHRALSEAARRETVGAADPVAALCRYVSGQVRYREGAMELGLPGADPRPAHETFDLRFGDCKDQATLLLTMLAEAGIEAYPALLRRTSSGPPRDAAPALGQFDHVVVAVPAGDRWRWLDPTWSLGPVDYPPPDIQGARALLARPGEPRWLEVPVPPAEANEHRREGELAIDADGALRGRVELTATGLWERSLRERFRGLEAPGITAELTEGLSAAWSNVSLEAALEAWTPSADLAAPYRLAYTISAAGATERTRGLLLLRANPLEQAEVPRPVEGPPRPLRIAPAASRASQRLVFRLGAGVTVEELPASVSRRAAWGEFDVRVRPAAGGWTIERTVTIRRPVVAADDVAAVRDWLAALRDADRAWAVLRRTAAGG